MHSRMKNIVSAQKREIWDAPQAYFAFPLSVLTRPWHKIYTEYPNSWSLVCPQRSVCSMSNPVCTGSWEMFLDGQMQFIFNVNHTHRGQSIAQSIQKKKGGENLSLQHKHPSKRNSWLPANKPKLTGPLLSIQSNCVTSGDYFVSNW